MVDVIDPLISGPIRGVFRVGMLGLRFFRLGLRLKLTKAKHSKKISNVRAKREGGVQGLGSQKVNNWLAVILHAT